MLLAETLRERADAQRRLANLRNRVAASARHTEGEEPAEDASALLAEAEAVVDRIAVLVTAINATNLATVLEDGRSLTEALADRNALRARHRLLTEAADAAAGNQGAFARLGRNELRTFATLDVTALRARADEVAVAIRGLDLAIERSNVTTELVEQA